MWCSLLVSLGFPNVKIAPLSLSPSYPYCSQRGLHSGEIQFLQNKTSRKFLKSLLVSLLARLELVNYTIYNSTFYYTIMHLGLHTTEEAHGIAQPHSP